MSPTVSVIVPVFNPGRDIDECVDSLLSQTMPPGELELIFVDDGSTDGTYERLLALAHAHPHVRLARIPNSGWPGRPRNIGLDMARGEYVYFVDNDDWLERDAIARVHATAERDRADVVIGKVVGHGRTVPRGLFRENLHAVPFDSPRLLGLLTPHKLFRRRMLVEHGIRFPEGRVRLEDHLFVVHAYFHAKGISVVADTPCYHWMLRDRSRHASNQRLDPEGYYGNVREVLDLVREHPEPGPLRDRLLAHWYRGKMLGRVGGGSFTRRDEAFNRALVDEIRALALERYDERVHGQLKFNLQLRSQLLRAGDYDGLVRLAELESRLRAQIKATVRGDGRQVAIKLTATMSNLDVDGRDLPLADSHVQVFLHSARDATEYLIPTDTTVALDRHGEPVLTARADVAAATAAAGGPLPAGDWEVRAVVTVAGFSHARSVRRNGAPLVLHAAPPRLAVRRDVLLRQPMARRLLARLQPVVPIVNRA